MPVALHTAFAILVAFMDESLAKNVGIPVTIVGQFIGGLLVDFLLT